MEYKGYQSEVSKMTQVSRDTVFRLEKDLENQRDNNKSLQAQLKESKLIEACLSDDKRKQDEQSVEYEKKAKQSGYRIERLQIEIKKQKDRKEALKEEIMDYKVNISELVDRNYEDNAEHRRQQHELLSESKKANEKIEDLHLHIKQRIQFEDQLKSDIEVLKSKISGLSLTVENKIFEKAEISKLYTSSKGRMTELEDNIQDKEEQIENLKISSEELRGQVLRVREEKDNLASTIDDNYQVMLEQQYMQIKLLENKLSEQEEKLSNCTRHNNEITQLLMNSRKVECDVNMLHENDHQRRATKV